MKYTQLFFNNNFYERDNTKLDLIALMQKANFVHQDSAGIYSWLSLGLILEKKVEQIVHEEMEKIGFSQIRLSILQDSQLWKKTGRFTTYGEELFKLKNRKEQDFCLAATCEEVITNIVKDHYNRSDMNINVYQIGNKYRDELRAKAGLIRAKEFIMKDGYSFCSKEEDIENIYQLVKKAYCTIFEKLELKFTIFNSDNGEIGGKSSEEFHCESEYGEDIHNEKTTLEIAHIFNLGQTYSKQLELVSNNKEHIFMACFGIGISRIVMALLEKQRDSYGFWGSNEFYTYDTIITVIDYKLEEHQSKANEIYLSLKKMGKSVLLDDRNTNAGKKMADSELIACKQRIIISKQSLSNNTVEVLDRRTMQKEMVSLDKLNDYLLNNLNN